MTFFTRSQFIDFCHNTFGEYKLTNGGDNINVICPFCKENQPFGYSKRKLVIQTQTTIYHCWKCGIKGKNLLYIIRKYFKSHEDFYKEKFLDSDVLISEKINETLKHEVRFPDNFILLASANKKDLYNSKAIEYLKKRKINLEFDLWYWKLGVSTGDKNLLNRIIVPSFDENGDFNFYSARDFVGFHKSKYHNPFCERENIVFNEINLNWEKELIVVEGVFDLMKCTENATCLLGSDLSANYKLFQKIITNKTPTVLALDMNAYSKTLKMAERLFEFDVPVKILEIPNIFEDVGSMTKNQFIDILSNATIFDRDFLLRKKILSIV